MAHFESCSKHCTRAKEWLADPEGLSETERGLEPNAVIIERARSICPGVDLYLVDKLNPENFNEDGSMILAPGAVEVHCNFYQADHGPDMGS